MWSLGIRFFLYNTNYMKKIAIIRPNRLTYTQNDYTHSRFSKENIENDIEDYIDFKEIKDEPTEIIMSIGTIINLREELICYTTRCHEDSKYIYELCHKEDPNEQINNIGIRLAQSKYRVTGNSVLIKSKILPNNTTELCTITLDEIVDIFRGFVIHTGVIIESNGLLTEYKYIYSPIDWKKQEEVQNIRYYEYNCFNLVVMMFIEVNTDKTINEKASIIAGETVTGKVLLALRHKPDDIRDQDINYCELIKDTAEKLISIMSVNKAKLDTSIYETLEKIEGRKQTDGFFITLRDKYLVYTQLYKNDIFSRELLDTHNRSTSLNEKTLMKMDL